MRCPECGRFMGKANPNLLAIVKATVGYWCEHCQEMYIEK